MTATGMAIQLRDVSFTWPSAKEPLFSGIELNVPAGTAWGFIGPNGSGKTTLLELILGWRKALGGRIDVENRLLETVPVRERGRMMALVPQEERLAFSYSVLEYVLLGRAPYLAPVAAPKRRDVDLAHVFLKRVGISHLAHRAVPRLSGGEKRLVLLARALVQEPRILLLDEPTNHLDPANRERLMDILAGLKSDGITLIMSSHEPDMVMRLVDGVVLLQKGGHSEYGRPEEMLVPEKLAALYGVKVRIVESHGRRIMIWGS